MEKIKKILEKKLDPSIHILDIKRDVHTNTIRVIVDTEDILTLDRTAGISKEISSFPEMDNLFPGGYQLEVSSPGVGSPLLHPFQYKKNIGRKLGLKVEIDNKKSNVTGKLLEADDNGIKILSKKQEIQVGYDQILNAVVKVSFK